jgi:hypothetical protein
LVPDVNGVLPSCRHVARRRVALLRFVGWVCGLSAHFGFPALHPRGNATPGCFPSALVANHPFVWSSCRAQCAPMGGGTGQTIQEHPKFLGMFLFVSDTATPARGQGDSILCSRVMHSFPVPVLTIWYVCLVAGWEVRPVRWGSVAVAPAEWGLCDRAHHLGNTSPDHRPRLTNVRIHFPEHTVYSPDLPTRYIMMPARQPPSPFFCSQAAEVLGRNTTFSACALAHTFPVATYMLYLAVSALSGRVYMRWPPCDVRGRFCALCPDHTILVQAD